MEIKYLDFLFVLMIAVQPSCSDDTSDEPTDTIEELQSDPVDGDHSDTEPVDDGLGQDTSADVWHPTPGTTWQWQLTGQLDTNVEVDMYDVDLFLTSADTISALQTDGRIVICYFSAGTREDSRDDAGEFEEADYGQALPEWPDEQWLDTRSENARRIMRARLDAAVQRGCDGVEPDNVDAYGNSSGFPLTRADQINYNQFLAREAHSRGLSVGLKNAVDLVDDLIDDFDWALNEECVEYNECGRLASFINAGKAVFHVEYVEETSEGSGAADDRLRRFDDRRLFHPHQDMGPRCLAPYLRLNRPRRKSA